MISAQNPPASPDTGAERMPPGAVGASVPQLDGDEKLTGQAQFIADLYRPGMLHGAILQSPHAHARIRGYNLRAALALPQGAGQLLADYAEQRIHNLTARQVTA
jgi:CO/xanthine dehydrogenase Mo-binding subunit